MPRYSSEIREYAKKLYLTFNEQGGRVYSFQDIAREINRKFNVKTNKITIYNWAKKGGWDKIISQAIVVSGIEEENSGPITRIVDELPVDEELIAKLARVKRFILTEHLKILKKLYEQIKDMDVNHKRFARLCEVADRVGKSIFEMLSDIEPSEKGDSDRPIVIVGELNINQEEKDEFSN